MQLTCSGAARDVDILPEGSVDPVYQAKAHVLNQAIQDIGMGKYQVGLHCRSALNFALTIIPGSWRSYINLIELNAGCSGSSSSSLGSAGSRELLSSPPARTYSSDIVVNSDNLWPVWSFALNLGYMT